VKRGGAARAQHELSGSRGETQRETKETKRQKPAHETKQKSTRQAKTDRRQQRPSLTCRVVTEEQSVHQIDRALCEQDRKLEQKSNTATGWELQQDVKKAKILRKINPCA
jgi:hypothetical protein